jgi:hypothetical protein
MGNKRFCYKINQKIDYDAKALTIDGPNNFYLTTTLESNDYKLLLKLIIDNDWNYFIQEIKRNEIDIYIPSFFIFRCGKGVGPDCYELYLNINDITEFNSSFSEILLKRILSKNKNKIQKKLKILLKNKTMKLKIITKK